MKKTIYTLLGLLLAAGLTSCQDWFIEKPEVTGMDQDEVFSTAKNAEGAIAEAYATILSQGFCAAADRYENADLPGWILHGDDWRRLCGSKDQGKGVADDPFREVGQPDFCTGYDAGRCGRGWHGLRRHGRDPVTEDTVFLRSDKMIENT